MSERISLASYFKSIRGDLVSFFLKMNVISYFVSPVVGWDLFVCLFSMHTRDERDVDVETRNLFLEEIWRVSFIFPSLAFHSSSTRKLQFSDLKRT